MNSFGLSFRVSIFGESHGEGIGIVLDGVPQGISLSGADFDTDIARRSSGARGAAARGEIGTTGTTPRIEADEAHILSGVFNGHTTGAPLAIIFHNNNTRSTDYQQFSIMPRPGHADYVASVKWGNDNDPRGGGHFSGRITLPIELRRTLGVSERDPLEIFVDEDRIILKKYEPTDIFNGAKDNLYEYCGKKVSDKTSRKLF